MDELYELLTREATRSPLPPVPPFEQLVSRARRRRRVRLLAATSAVCVLVAGIAVATALTPGGHSSSAPAVSGSSDLVPWVDRPASPPPFPATPTPPPPAYPACAAGQLQARITGGGAAAGNDIEEISLTNISAANCTLSGYAQHAVGVREDGTRQTLPTGPAITTMFDSRYAWPANLRPGQSAGVGIATTSTCGLPKETNFQALELTLAGGGTLHIAGDFAYYCTVAITGMGAPTPSAPDPQAYPGVIASSTMPAVVTAGETVTYVVTLTNTTSRDVALGPCPVYTESIYSPAVASPSVHSYYLNCDTVRSIPAHGRVRYQMKIQAPDAPSQGGKFGWDIPNSQSARVGAGIAIDAGASPSAVSLPPPSPAVCGTWSNPSYSETGKQITARYGEIRSCGSLTSGWFITTEGTAKQPGMLGIYLCPTADHVCRDGTTDHPLAKWRWRQPPGPPGGVSYVHKQGDALYLHTSGGYVAYHADTDTFRAGEVP